MSVRHRWIAAALVAACTALHAKPPYVEKPGAKDHPLVSRFKGSVLFNDGSRDFEQVKVALDATRDEVVEGKVTNLVYVMPRDRTELEAIRSYRQALEAAGFRMLAYCEDAPACQQARFGRHVQAVSGEASTFRGGYSPISRLEFSGNYPERYLAARLARDAGDVTVVVTAQAPHSGQQAAEVGGPVFVQVVESRPMEQGSVTVDAQALSRGLEAEGRIALYGLTFDTGKADIKPESAPQLEQMAKLLKGQPQLKVFIVGHTDNQGALEANEALSLRRAQAVVAALEAAPHGIDRRRMLARGVANVAPVASNAAEAGRARNRRVELVAQ